ncbi:APO protein 3, mitochondrial-like isoform X2 [Lycium ferocissimum]|uniref:APO protein 3, mitochondrial-like isoform X2 n=1 Tax=Lycium ferocissimum TaxID=112874 RepID=UPI002816349F|nr:APO protein 3, mitochondrial-like isoform X2 [Lycium ferocissimum]
MWSAIISTIKELGNVGPLYSSATALEALPRNLKRAEKKPWVTNINELKRRGRVDKQERKVVREVALRPPENGLLVKELILVAHQVLASRSQLLACVSRISEEIPIYFCSFCSEVHVGHPPHKIRTCDVSGSQKNKEHTWQRGGAEHIVPVVESFHLYDRLGRAVSHNERLEVDRIPALVELCIQAGVDLHEYPTRRRKFPIYRVAGKLLDFEKRFPKDDLSWKDIETSKSKETMKKLSGDGKYLNLHYDDIKGFAMRGSEAWEIMCTGAIQLMQKYPVQTCGYCPEVQVGPKGHRVRQCQAFKHQMRDGQHGWQEATIDDLLSTVYVWHVRNPHAGDLLVDSLKRYYGKLPAVVELFNQAGAQVGDDYHCMMREDVAVPGLDEEKLVV